jgi:folate-binding protein YgfZ
MNTAEVYARIGTHGGVASLDRAKFKLTGGDRVRYLNGQASNDVRKLTPETAMHACVMTAKGKMCADIFISAAQDYLLIDAEPSLRESLAARLERYIISDDVFLEDVTDELSLIHIIGIANPESIAGGAITPRKSRRFGRAGWDLFLTREESDRVRPVLLEKLPAIDGEMLETMRIEAGIPRWGHELGEDTLPVEAGLDKTAIDYHKGCYIGQEVISRLKSVGHVNKELRGFISLDGKPLTAGMRLHAPGEPGKDAGWLTSAAYSFALEKPVALGYVRRGTAQGALNARSQNAAGDQDTCSVQVKELPIIP